MPLVVEPPACMVRVGRGFLQSGIRRDHFAWDQVLPDVEMFERALCLRSPQLAVRHIDFTEAVSFFSNARYLHIDIADCTHLSSPCCVALQLSLSHSFFFHDVRRGGKNYIRPETRQKVIFSS